MLFATLVEDHVKSGLLAGFKLIQIQTCIKFKEIHLPLLDTATVQKFAVVFSKHGKRHVLYST